MNEESIKRIEKKIDMLYKIVLGIGGIEVDNPISDIDCLEELVPLFNLSINTSLFVKMEKLLKLVVAEVERHEEVEKKLDELKNDYKTGNFLEKEKDKMWQKVRNQEKKYKALIKLGEYTEGLVYEAKITRKGLLFLNLKEKLGISLSENDIEYKKKLEKGFEKTISGIQAKLKEYKGFK